MIEKHPTIKELDLCEIVWKEEELLYLLKLQKLEGLIIGSSIRPTLYDIQTLKKGSLQTLIESKLKKFGWRGHGLNTKSLIGLELNEGIECLILQANLGLNFEKNLPRNLNEFHYQNGIGSDWITDNPKELPFFEELGKRSLKSLTIRYHQVFLKPLEGNLNLTYLDLSHTIIRDDHKILETFVNLKTLYLSCNSITKVDLSVLKNLEVLYFEQMELKEEISDYIEDLLSLKQLYLYDSHLKDKHVQKFTKLKNLEIIDIRWNDLTNKSLEILTDGSKFPKLKKIVTDLKTDITHSIIVQNHDSNSQSPFDD